QLRERLLAQLSAAKTKDARDDALEKINSVITAPITLQVPGVDMNISESRAATLSRFTGMDRETVQGITPALLSVMMALVELFFPFLGFSRWPMRPEPSIPSGIERSTAKESADIWRHSPFPRRATASEAL